MDHIVSGVGVIDKSVLVIEAVQASAERKALPMVRCHHCGVHLPGSDAVNGRDGAYCSVAHRRESEGA